MTFFFFWIQHLVELFALFSSRGGIIFSFSDHLRSKSRPPFEITLKFGRAQKAFDMGLTLALFSSLAFYISLAFLLCRFRFLTGAAMFQRKALYHALAFSTAINQKQAKLSSYSKPQEKTASLAHKNTMLSRLFGLVSKNRGSRKITLNMQIRF